MRRLLALPFLALLVGCSEPRTVLPAPKLQLHDTQTVHNATAVDATRVWIVQTGVDGHQRIVLCDMAFMVTPADPKRLCVAWPP